MVIGTQERVRGPSRQAGRTDIGGRLVQSARHAYDNASPGVALPLAAACALLVLQIFAARHASYYGQDILSVWKAERNMVHGHPVFTQYRDSLPYIYPPSSTLLLAPLGWLPLATAKTLMLCLGGACVAVAAFFSVRVATSGRLTPSVAWLLVVLAASDPLRDALTNLNLSLIVAVFLPVCLWSWHRHHDLAAALLLGLSLSLKPMLLPLLIVPILRRRPFHVAVALAPPILFSVVALPLLSDPETFFSKVVPDLLSSSAGRLGPHNTSIAGLAQTFEVATPLALALRLIVVVIACAVAWRAWRGNLSEGKKLTFATGVLLLGWCLAGSVNEPHYELLLLPLLVYLVSESALIFGALAGLGGALFLTTMRLPTIAGTETENRGLVQSIGLVLVLLACTQTLARGGGHRSKSAFGPEVTNTP